MSLNITTNGKVDLDGATEEQAKKFFESLETVNLDEITTTTIRVGIHDFRLAPGTQTRQFYNRVAEIENFVPMRVFNRMMASRNRVLQMREKYLANPKDDATYDPMMSWMLEQVLAVWQITEPDMTMERLENGLSFEKMSRLFTLFFARLLQTNAR